MTEKWKPISGYEEFYEVSTHGRVRSLDRIVEDSFQGSTRTRLFRGLLLRQHLAGPQRAYLTVSLSKGGHMTRVIVHRLVAQAFIPNPSNKPEVNHIDCDTMNNHVSNLEWATRRENIHHGMMHGRINQVGEAAPRAKLTNRDVLEIKRRLAMGEYQHHIADAFDVTQTTISAINTGRVWSHIVYRHPRPGTELSQLQNQ